MNFVPTSLKGVIVVEPDLFRDGRGFFLETFRRDNTPAVELTPSSDRTTSRVQDIIQSAACMHNGSIRKESWSEQ